MKSAIRHIAAMLVCVFACLSAKAQESLDSELERYEQMCALCLELKDRLAKGEQISRDEERSTIDFFRDYQ